MIKAEILSLSSEMRQKTVMRCVRVSNLFVLTLTFNDTYRFPYCWEVGRVRYTFWRCPATCISLYFHELFDSLHSQIIHLLASIDTEDRHVFSSCTSLAKAINEASTFTTE